MKKLLSTLFILAIIGLPVLAEEAIQQEQTVEGVRAMVGVQKQPTQENAKQKQEIKNVWFSIIVQVQGKVPFIEKEEK